MLKTKGSSLKKTFKIFAMANYEVKDTTWGYGAEANNWNVTPARKDTRNYDAKEGMKTYSYTLFDDYATHYVDLKFKDTKDVNITFKEKKLADEFAPFLVLKKGGLLLRRSYIDIERGLKNSESKILQGDESVDHFDNVTMVAPATNFSGFWGE